MTTSTDGVSDWSDPLDVEVGLIDPSDWTAVPITATFAETPPERPIRFRRAFSVRPRARASPALRIGTRDLHRRVQRLADRRRRPRAGLDELPPPTPLPDVRRHGRRPRRRERVRRHRRRGVVPRPPRLPRRPPRGLRHRHRSDRAAGALLRRRHDRRRSPRIVTGAPVSGPTSRPACTTARRTTPDWPSRRGRHRASTTATGSRSASSRRSPT